MKSFLCLIASLLILISGDYLFGQGRPPRGVPRGGGFPQQRERESRIYVGAVFAELDENTKKQYGIRSGVGIRRVIQDSPAEKAGLKPGDIIVQFDGEEVLDVRAMERFVKRLKESEEVSLEVLRDGNKQMLSMIPEKKQSTDRDAPHSTNRSAKHLGAQLSEIDESLAAYFKVTAHSGVLITEVEAGGPADSAGLKAGDIATRVNDQAVPSPEEMRRIIDELKTDESVKIVILRQGKEMNFSFQPGKLDRRVRSAEEPRPSRSEIGEKDRAEVQELRKQIRREYEEEMAPLREQMRSGPDPEAAREKMQKLKEEMEEELQRKLQNLDEEDKGESETEEEIVNE